MMLQTSVWFNRIIAHSKALYKAIYYIPAAHRRHCGKLLIRLINDLFRAMTLHQYFTLFINTPPAFQPSLLLSRTLILRVSADGRAAFNIRHYSARYCVSVHFLLVIPFLFHVIWCPKTSLSKDYLQLFIFTECTCQSWHLLEALLRALLPKAIP